MTTTATELAELNAFLRENKAEAASRMLSKNRALVAKTDDAGRSAIHWAASGGCVDIVRYCMSENAELADTPDDMLWTPLMIATSAGRLEIVRDLLARSDVNVNARNANKQTSLHYAASKNHPQILKLLLENGAEVNAQDSYGATPLHRAASQGHEKVVALLLEVPGIQIDLKDSTGSSAFQSYSRHLAVDENREDIAISLAKHGANISLENKEKETPLNTAKSAQLREKLQKAAANAK